MADTQRGKLKLFLGYAAGVGKTYKMLEEGQALRAQGADVAIGYFEPHGRKDTIAKTDNLESIPRAKIHYRGSVFDEMDTDAIIARRPQICLVDEYAHTNIPGSPRVKRWEDIELLRDAGIHVLTTMNIQHLESLNDQVRQLTGVQVRETIPDWVVQQADEVVLIDLTPRALLHRLERGVIYDPEKIERARQNFFREGTLVNLREMALREAAHELAHRIIRTENGSWSDKPAEQAKPHKILVLVTEHPQTAMSIRRAKRMGDYLGAECFAVAVQPSGDLDALAEADRDAFMRHLNFARNMRLETRILKGEDLARTLVEFARGNDITQIYLARPDERKWSHLFSRSILQRIVSLARDMQIVIVAERVAETE
jgi:two-component system, OmpR family, sensor histidine kinase KdpD